MVRREGFEPPAFWSVGCLTRKSESFRLRFVLFATVRSADFPLFPSSPARFFRILGQNWVRSCREESGAAKHEIKKCPKMKKHLHRTFACGASFCRAKNRRKRGWNVDRGCSDDISCQIKDVSCRRPHKSRKICYTENPNLKNCPGAPPDP